MKCPNCGSEVDTSICVACPNCKTRMPNTYAPEIGMQDSFGNTMTVGGSLDKPRKKVNPKVVVPLIIVVVIAAIVIGIIVYNQPRTHEEAIALAREDAKEVVNKQLKYENLNTWYANTYVTDNGNNKFIIYCDVQGWLTTGEYCRIQTYVGIELKAQKGDKGYSYWTMSNIYPYGESNGSSYVEQLKNKMGW